MIPGAIISLLTFPGTIVHELAHLVMCKLVGAKVHKACLFRFGSPPGYVLHDVPTAMRHILIGIGPFIFNSILGALISLPGMLTFLGHRHPSAVDYVLVWLGVSIAMHAFPSRGDAAAIWRSIWSRDASVLAKVLGVPVVALIYVGAFGSVLWLDLIYGATVSVLLPVLLVRAHW